MTRTLTLTPDEWAAVQAGGWLVRRGDMCHTTQCAWSGPPPWPDHDCRCKGQMQPPWSLVVAAAPCETCGGRRWHPATSADEPGSACTHCRITLLGECPHCKGNPAKYRDVCSGTVTLGHAHAVGEVLPILAPGQDPSPGVDKWVSHICDYPDRGLCLWEYNGGTGSGPGWKVSGGLSLAPYGDPAALVGQYALRLEVLPA